jgi:hypothetical protein
MTNTVKKLSSPINGLLEDKMLRHEVMMLLA